MSSISLFSRFETDQTLRLVHGRHPRAQPNAYDQARAELESGFTHNQHVVAMQMIQIARDDIATYGPGRTDLNNNYSQTYNPDGNERPGLYRFANQFYSQWSSAPVGAGTITSGSYSLVNLCHGARRLFLGNLIGEGIDGALE
ncbi:MAG: hypothetical protein Q9220_000768 [cf. Caloplaca sp. 1 TL-2023]